MCISVGLATAISAISTVAGTVVSMAQASAQAQMTKYQIEMQNKQLQDQQEMTRLQAQQTENARLEEDRKLRARNEAMIAASGVSANTSFLQGIDEYNAKATRNDIATLRLNSQSEVNRIANQISVNKAQAQWASMKAGYSIAGSLFSGMGSLGQLAMR